MCGNYIHSKPKVKKHFQHCPTVTYKDHCWTKVTKVAKEGIRFTKYVIEDFNVHHEDMLLTYFKSSDIF